MTVRSDQREEFNWWPWIGLVGVILGYVATWAVQFSIGDDELQAGGQTLIDALDSGGNETLWRVTSGLGYIGVACLIWFAAGLRNMLLRRSGGEALLPNVIFGSFLVTCGALIVAMSFRAQVFDGIDYYDADPSSHVTLNRLSQDTVLSVWAGLAAATAAAALGGIRGNLFPAWFGWLSAIVTLLVVLLVLAGLAFPANMPIGLWLLALTIWSIGEQRRSPRT